MTTPGIPVISNAVSAMPTCLTGMTKRKRRTVDLRNPELLAALNTATKYPSIPTYHKFGEKGRLTEELNVIFKGAVIGTEKIDGTNTRIILPPGNDYIIGSREELLFSGGDLLY